MNCEKIKNRLLFYAEKELTSAESREIEIHLADCRECSELYHKISETLKAVSIQDEIEPRAFFAESILNKIEAIENFQEKEKFSYDYLLSHFFKKLAISGAAFLVVLVLFFYVTEGSLSFNFLSDDDSISNDNTSELFFENSN